MLEAKAALDEDPYHPLASKYLGWDLLNGQDWSIEATELAIQYLETSIASGDLTSLIPIPGNC